MNKDNKAENNILNMRQEIDVIDDKIAELYNQRMAVVARIGEAKAISKLATQNTLREKEIVNRVTKTMPDEIKLYTKQVFDTVFNTSKAYQAQLISSESEIKRQLECALLNKLKPFPTSATVACQGVAGAYSQIAADKMFAISDIMYVKDWNAVFGAVESGLCEFGVLPIENSSVGSVNAVYDLIKKHRCYIVRSVRLRIQHCLLVKKGVKLQDVKEIYSHEQAIGQCSQFIKSLPDVKITMCENTAVAAKTVRDSQRNDVACIASHDCCGIYGLSVLNWNTQDSDQNYTRFIAISKKLQVFEDSNKISIMVNLPHEAGSLNALLNRFSTLGLNLTKLESRPIEGAPFEFAFYFGFDAKIQRTEVRNLIAELENTYERFVFLGSYEEIFG